MAMDRNATTAALRSSTTPHNSHVAPFAERCGVWRACELDARWLDGDDGWGPHRRVARVADDWHQRAWYQVTVPVTPPTHI